MRPLLRSLEGRDQVQNRFALLAGDHAAIGEAAPVKVALHSKLDRVRIAATAEEIGVERVSVPVVGYRAASRDEGLRDRLAAEYPSCPLVEAAANESVAAARVEVEQENQLGDETFGSRRVNGQSRHAVRLARRRGGSQLMPGIRRSRRQAIALPRFRMGQRIGGRGLSP